ncbi:MAG: DUF2332 family protein [Natronohydrobacter sp.]|nr:DUF2332 family protein [Natronohydrobacter sp.]
MNFRAHAREQAAACLSLGSPFTARLLSLVADRLRPETPVAEALLTWPTERMQADAVALRLAGALHHLVLTGQAQVLARLYASQGNVADAQLWHAVDAALRLKAGPILDTLALAPQTNEVGRASVYIAAAHWLSAAYRLPLVISELGSAAGLNLLWDQYALVIEGQIWGSPDAAIRLAPDWTGPLPPMAPPLIRSRAGVDLNPLDPVADRARLLSYIWADQTERLARMGTALDLATEKRPDVARAHAIDWLETRLSRPIPQAVHLVCHTVAWQYFPEAEQARGLALLARAGGRVRMDEPLAHLSMEADGAGPGAALVVHLWPGNDRIVLGRADFHGRWIDWQAPEL